MRLTSTGLGIGTSSPSQKLSLQGSSTTYALAETTGTGTSAGFRMKAGASADYTLFTTQGVNQFAIYDNVAATERLTLSSSGNLGLGVTPSAWATSKAFQIGNRASLFSFNNLTVDVGNNLYFNGSDYKYIETATATFYRQNTGTHSWYTAASGTAGNTISFTQAMTLASGGNLTLGSGSTSATGERFAAYGAAGTGGDVNISVYDTTSGKSAKMLVTGTSYNYAGMGASEAVVYAYDSNITLCADGVKAIKFATNALERMRIDSSGNVGIGTSSPTTALTFPNGSTGITLSGANQPVILKNDANGLVITQASYDKFKLRGIGGSAENTQLQLGTLNSAAQPQYSFIDDSNTGISNPAADTLSISTGGTERARIDSSGYLLLGTTTAAGNSRLVVATTTAVDATLTVKAEAANYASIINIEAQNDNGAIYNYIASNTTSVTQHWKISGGAATNTMAFSTGGSERARFNSVGDLLVGDTGNAIGSKVYVNAGSAGEGVGILVNSSNSYRPLVLWNSASSGNRMVIFYTGSGPAAAGSIESSGTTTTYNTSSDYRLKNITGPITNSGAYSDSLKPVEGTWKADGSAFVGLIAHEVQEVSRTFVATGVKDSEEMQGMDYSSPEIIANLIAEIQSLRKRLADAGI